MKTSMNDHGIEGGLSDAVFKAADLKRKGTLKMDVSDEEETENWVSGFRPKKVG